MNGLNINYDEVITLGSQIFNKGDEFGEIVEKINSVLNELSTCWQGEDATKVLGKLTDESEKKVFEYHDTGWRYPTQVWKYQRDCLKSNLHPTQKPLALCEDLIRTFSNENDLILDNCMGSGTTGVACVNTDRKFIGIELNQQYFEIAKNRIQDIAV